MSLKQIIPVLTLIIFIASLKLVSAQFPPPITAATNLTVIRSSIDPNISITYKSPDPGTCTTAFERQRQYVGHVNLPPFSLAPIQQNYAINTFFWFIESRESPETAPLTIWFNGGPGSSSMIGMFQENGPCEVIELAKGKLGTKAREWGWDRSSNIMFVDQPNKVGFSYDSLVNGSINLLDSQGTIYVPPISAPTDLPPYIYLNGTFSSTNYRATTNTTEISARAIWHMLQGFLSVFPQYNPGVQPNSNQAGPVGVNLFAESYGGHYGPAFASFWDEQNERRKNGSLPQASTLEVKLRSLGIVNGCVDDLVQGPSYPAFASQNTYGIQVISKSESAQLIGDFLSTGGCKDLISQCRTAAAALDFYDTGNNTSVNSICQQAAISCNNLMEYSYDSGGKSYYDIAHPYLDPFPPLFYLEYLNSGNVLKSIGSPVNFTQSNVEVQAAFIYTGDSERAASLSDLTYLLRRGIRVALIYGDRDYICNWFGGEQISFAIADNAGSQYAPFYNAGYADIHVNASYIGGQVRQYGNLSFSRVYQAGHLVPSYQPETAFTIFTRIIQGTDISTGKDVDLSSFGTTGTANSTHTDEAPDSPSPICFIRAIPSTCLDAQQEKIRAGEGVVINGVWYNQESDWHSPDSTSAIEGTSTTAATGVYVATGTATVAPKKGDAGKSRLLPVKIMEIILGAVIISGLLL